MYHVYRSTAHVYDSDVDRCMSVKRYTIARSTSDGLNKAHQRLTDRGLKVYSMITERLL